MALKIEPIRQQRLPNGSIYATSASTKDWMSMKPDLETELHATVASLRIKASCH
ncbi:hypothetical protein [Acidisoma silvae]|uniref:Uncharacterized protein n=1 Tax=Acidisoma silvae TaxID=2802396 RepID=A0A963YVF3_9PROT|nr:hypothetical protein [Acidisoma silvae]MCB8877819.1 hypothetical protein [Acidisoma silvae]